MGKDIGKWMGTQQLEYGTAARRDLRERSRLAEKLSGFARDPACEGMGCPLASLSRLVGRRTGNRQTRAAADTDGYNSGSLGIPGHPTSTVTVPVTWCNSFPLMNSVLWEWTAQPVM